MENSNLVPVDLICTVHKIEYAFVYELHEYELIEVITIEDSKFLHVESLPELERILRLHNELDINLEGIIVISNLLNRIENLESELEQAKKIISIYTSED